MSATVTKQVQIADYRANRLKQLAAERATTENALIEEGLDLLFREQERQTAREEAFKEDAELLRQMEAEFGPIPVSSASPVELEGAVFLVGTPIAPERIRHIGE